MKRERKKGLMKVVLFVCRLRKMANAADASTNGNEMGQLDDDETPGTSDQCAKRLSRCSTLPVVDVIGPPSSGSSRSSSRNTLSSVFDLDLPFPRRSPAHRGSGTGSHLSLPLQLGMRSRSGSATSSTASLCNMGMRPRTQTDPGEMPRFWDFVGINKPYTLNVVGNNLMKSSKSFQILQRSAFAGWNKNDPMMKSKLVRRLSSREGLIEDYHTKGTANVNRLPKSASQTCNVVRSTSDENVKAELTSAAVASPPSMRRLNKRKSTDDLLDVKAVTNSENVKPFSKADRKRLEKLRENKRELLELYTAVEQDDIGKVRSMLQQQSDLDINYENCDGWTILDVACMLNHVDVALLLLKHGAQENSRLSGNQRLKQLQGLIDSGNAKLVELGVAAKQPTAPAKDIDKQISSLESRIHMLKKMKVNCETTECPGSPVNVVLNVASATSLTVQFQAPDQSKRVVTKYKVEWSTDGEFEHVQGCLVLKDVRRCEATLPNLVTGESYYVRVSAGNFKGYGPPAASTPSHATPSSWRDVNCVMRRFHGQLQDLTQLYREVTEYKKSLKWNRGNGSGELQKRKKATLKNLFQSSTKFHRSLTKGVYLATVLYCEDKVLCTVDDCLPIIEIDENCPSSLTADFYWFMKLSCCWDDLRSLAVNVDAAHSSPAVQFRLKLIEAASEMQTALGVTDLGRLHHEMITDDHGVTILTTVQRVNDPKMAQGLAVKWLPMSKYLRKQLPFQEEKYLSATDCLSTKLLDHVNFYESSNIPLDRGLYLGYVKLQSNMNQISLLVPENLPSVLPFVFIRENHHVSREEWEWLHLLRADGAPTKQPNAAQLAFHWALASAAQILLDDLDVPYEEAIQHRIFNLEVIEIHSDVSFILLVPSKTDVCSVPGQPTVFSESKRGCLPLPVPIFETVHFCAYQPDFISLYCRLSCLLDLQVQVANQQSRQAFLDHEAKSSKDWLTVLAQFQRRLEEMWKAVRWVTDVVSTARDKLVNSGVPVEALTRYQASQSSSSIALTSDGAASSADDVRPSSSDLAPRNGDRSEENSDVGYHSDQSIDKMGLATPRVESSSNGTLKESTSVTSPHLESPGAEHQHWDNPTYDLLQATTPLQNYVNLPIPRSISTQDTSIRWQSNRDSFLQHQSRQMLRKYSDYVNEELGELAVREASYTMNIPIGQDGGLQMLAPPRAVPHELTYVSTASMCSNTSTATGSGQSTSGADSWSIHSSRPGLKKRHDYVNCASETELESQYLTAKKRLATVGTRQREGAPLDGSMSDVELNTRYKSVRDQLKPQPCAPPVVRRGATAEDLSAIDHMFRQPSPASRPPSREPIVPLPLRTTTSHNVTNHAVPKTQIPSNSGPHSTPSAILRVFAAYETGLTKGTSVKLHVTPKTTAWEVVQLVVRQLNRASELKGRTDAVYSDSAMRDFCLVAVIGSRERCLRDDFCPLDLQNPWSKGRLFVRKRGDLLAALEFGNSAAV